MPSCNRKQHNRMRQNIFQISLRVSPLIRIIEKYTVLVMNKTNFIQSICLDFVQDRIKLSAMDIRFQEEIVSKISRICDSYLDLSQVIESILLPLINLFTMLSIVLKSFDGSEHETYMFWKYPKEEVCNLKEELRNLKTWNKELKVRADEINRFLRSLRDHKYNIDENCDNRT